MNDDSDIELPESDIDADDALKEEVEAGIESDDEAGLEAIDVSEFADVDLGEGEDEGDSTSIVESEVKTPNAIPDDHILIKSRISARDSRMPDIPSIFELTAMIISRATLIEANSPPLIPFTIFDPAHIARDELVAGKSLRSVLRDNAEWKWSDFAYFPVSFVSTHESTVRLHEVT